MQDNINFLFHRKNCYTINYLLFFCLHIFHIIIYFTDRANEYIAFGLSGSDSGSAMLGADVVVAYFGDGEEAIGRM